MTPHDMKPHSTPHLTPEELIDSRERQLSPARQAHADACAVCRAERAQLDELLRDVAAVDVPEPSPLFWDHLSARIRDRVAHEPPPAPARENPFAGLIDWLTGWSAAPRWAFAAAMLVLCASVGWLGWSELRPRVNGPVTPGSVDVATVTATATPDPAESSVPTDLTENEWSVMLRMAEEVSWDDADGSSLDVRPAAVDRALTELTSEERDRLLQLVQADLARHQKS